MIQGPGKRERIGGVREMAERGQLSLSEALVSPRLGRNAALERLSVEVRWSRFETILARLKPEAAGRPRLIR